MFSVKLNSVKQCKTQFAFLHLFVKKMKHTRRKKENSEWETQVLYAVPDFKEQEPVSTGIAEGAWREEVLSRS